MGYLTDFATAWGYMADISRAIVNPTSALVEYLTKPTIDQTVEAFYNTSFIIANATSDVLNNTIPSDLILNTPGLKEAGLIGGVVTPLASFGVVMAQSFITIVDWSIFFLADPVFTILLFEWFIILLMVEQKQRGKVGGGEMVFKIFVYQFMAIRVIYEVSIRLIELSISFGSFIRRLIPII
jgi:hypothetical protein